MKKRILNIAILVVVLALCVVFFLVTCDRGGDGAGNGSTYKVDFTTYVDATVPSQNVEIGRASCRERVYWPV